MTISLSNPFLERTFLITQYFGVSAEAYKQFNLAGHNGLDFGCPEGTLLYAAYPGTVTKTGFDPEGYGNYIRITTDFGRLIYAHLSVPSAGINQKVTRGMFIGRSGNTGNSTGPHLHFEMRLDGKEGNGYNGAVDPYPYLFSGTPYVPNEPILPDVPVTPAPIKDAGTFTVEIAWLNIRNTNNVTGILIGRLTQGSIMRYTRTALDPDGNTWMQIADGIWCAANYGGEDYVSVV